MRRTAMIAPGISTEMVLTTLSAGCRDPVDQLGLVGPRDKTEQSVLPGSDANEVGTDSVSPVGPDVTVDQMQPVAEGPVGQYITRRPVGPDGMFSTCDSDQPVPDGPVGQSFILGPVGPDVTMDPRPVPRLIAGATITRKSHLLYHIYSHSSNRYTIYGSRVTND